MFSTMLRKSLDFTPAWRLLSALFVAMHDNVIQCEESQLWDGTMMDDAYDSDLIFEEGRMDHLIRLQLAGSPHSAPAECKVLDKILRPVPFQRKHFPPWSSALEVAALLQTAWGIKCETSTEMFFSDSFWQLVAASFEKLLAGSIGVAFLWPSTGSVWCFLWCSLWSDEIGRRWFCSSFQSIGIRS